MKAYIVKIIALFYLFGIYRSATAEIYREERAGYIINLKKDTQQVILSVPYSKIEGRVNLYKMCDKIKIVLIDGKKKTIKPHEILGYSFEDNSQWYHYKSFNLNKVVNTENNQSANSNDVYLSYSFLRCVTKGKATLYVYEYESRSAPMMGPGPSGVMYAGGNSKISSYYIEKNTIMFQISGMNFRKTIIPILSEDVELAKKIEEKEYKYKDIEQIVRDYNYTFR